MSRHKIMTLEALAETVASLKKDGKTIVTTNGCFDILHIGHIRYLQEARMLGDTLIVALNSDRSVKEHKGPKRPIHNENERSEALAALSCVDHVVIFDEMRADSVLEKIQPHIHTKGSDYTLEQIPERHVVLRHGGNVVLLENSEGYSTTNTIKKILDTYRE